MIVPSSQLNLHWEDVIGADTAITMIRRAVELPFLQPNLMATIDPTVGMLLYGPPGTGKTYLARAAATALYEISDSSQVRFFNVQLSVLEGRLVGQTERNLRSLFRVARRYTWNSDDTALEMVPDTQLNTLKSHRVIMFIDEVDTIGKNRMDPTSSNSSRSTTNELIVQMDGINSKVGAHIFFIGATNYPWVLDAAVLRRFGKAVYVRLPSPIVRLELLKHYLGGLEMKKLKKTPNDKLNTIARFKEQFRKLAENIISTGHLTKWSKNVIDEFPKLISHTAFFSNSDLQELANSIVASGVDHGISHYWENDSGEWKITEISTQNANPDPLKYKNLVDLEPDTLTLADAIVGDQVESTINKTKPNVLLEELYRMEWYSMTGEAPEIPSQDQLNASKLHKDTRLWIMYNLIMNTHTDNYEREFTMAVWRAIMEEESMDGSKKIEQIIRLWGRTEGIIANTLSELGKDIHKSWIPGTITSYFMVPTVENKNLGKKLAALYREFYSGWIVPEIVTQNLENREYRNDAEAVYRLPQKTRFDD
jgi:SpoVK/Ycf46/Vps4 family AAA+-type ATPase